MIFPCTIVVGQTPEIINQELCALLTTVGNELKQNNPDLFIIDQTSGWKIETVRELINFFSRKPYNHPSKIALIYHANQLSPEAQSVLLKTLEDPGEGNYVVLTTYNPNSLLTTIISRSHIINITGPQTISDLGTISISPNLRDNLESVNQLLVKYDKNNLNEWINNQINLIYPQLLSKSAISSASLISKLLRAKEMLQANVEARSVLDWIFIS